MHVHFMNMWNVMKPDEVHKVAHSIYFIAICLLWWISLLNNSESRFFTRKQKKQ